MKEKKAIHRVVEFKGALLKRLLKGLTIVTFTTTALCLLHQEFPQFNLDVSAQLPGYMGAALGLLLVFRNNTAYDKWWEARKDMGAMVNTTRNFAITINGSLPHENKEKFTIAKLIIAFVYATKEHLREGTKMDEVKEYLDKEDYNKVDNSAHKPNVIANIMLHRIENLYLQKHITDIQQYILVKHVNLLIDIMGKCERIRNTPIPMAYGFLLKFFIAIYVVVLPLGLLNEVGWWSIPLVMVLYYIMMSIVLTAEEIEEPFGKDVNDLPMEQISANIKRNINELVEHH